MWQKSLKILKFKLQNCVQFEFFSEQFKIFSRFKFFSFQDIIFNQISIFELMIGTKTPKIAVL